MSLIYHKRYLDHILTWGHPESPERLKAIMEKLKTADFKPEILTPDSATYNDLKGVHTSEYIELMKNFGEGWMDPNTYHHDESYELACLAAGGGLLAANLAYTEKRPTFVIPRPPGHHAEAGSSGGFCYFNNIAIAAQTLIDKNDSPAEKVAIIDIDVHHGNGTHDIFLNRKDVLYISTHQRGIYPGTGYAEITGDKAGEGYTVNIPLQSGTGDSSFELAYHQIIEPILKQYKPSMMLVSIGTDAHYRDPLAGLALSSNGYVSISEKMIKLSKLICDSKIAFFLEGGYDTQALAEIVTAILAIFNNHDYSLKFTDNMDKKCISAEGIKKILNVQKQYWNL
jgi:acetoin utilization deacetylase AcuC-like enzyme